MAEEVGGIVYEVGMDVSGLKAGASSAESELSKFDSAVSGSTKNLNKLDGQADSTGKAFSSLVSVVKSIDATLSKMAASSDGAASAVKSTSQSAESANQVIDALNQQLAMMQQQQQQAAVSTGRLETSINAVTTAIRELGTSTGGASASISGTERLIESLGNQVAILEEQMENGARSAAILAAQLRAGDGATDAQKAKIAELTGRLYDMKNGTESAGKSTNGFRNALQQGGYQVQDFIVQVQSGQSALVAFSQQGSQLASVFSPVAGAVLTIATVIAGSLMASLSNGKNAIDAMKDAISAMDQVISVSSNGVAAYSDKFAALAKANTTVATLMRQQAQLELSAALSKVSKEVSKASGEFVTFGDRLFASLSGANVSVKSFNDYLSMLNITTNDFGEAMKQAASAGLAGQSTMNSMIATVGALASRFDLTDQQAFEFAKQLSEIAKNPSNEKLNELIVTLQKVGEGQSSGAQKAREYAARLLEIATTTTDATMRLKALKEMTDSLTSSQDKALQTARQTLFIEKQTGDEKLKAQAWRDAEAQGLKQNTAAFREYYNVRLETYRQQEKNAQAAKDERNANNQLKTELKQQETIQQKLNKLRDEALLAGQAESTKELSREQAILNAQQSLGKAATQEQIKLAGEYAAKIWDQKNALKEQAEAEKEKQRVEKSYQGLRAIASPTTGIDSEYQQRMADLDAYAAAYPQKITEIEQTRAAIEAQYRQQRMDAMWAEWSQQNAATQAAAAAFDAFGQTAGNALTGILTGSMSVSDALRSIGSNILSSVINAFVQMGIDWAKSAIMGAAGMSAASAATIAQAAAISAAMAPAAAMTSLATAGTNSAPAMAGISATVGLAKTLSIAGALKNGGPAQEGSMYRVGENNLPEIFQASNGHQYMIPGDSGRVISNKDLTGGGSGVVVYNNVINNSSAQVSSSARDNGDGSVTIETIVSDISENGPIGQAISRNYNTNRRATE
ncbi:tail length tape measure protein [Salmonella phage Seszw_1]|uniref:Putative tail protein (Tape measure) n=1 Tax=Salmonella phage Seszw_1 TaxID=2479482 RepID=A0A411BF38_9CAUD|nr:tail length tape measure protein [Salmonella phage Seszw_1]QZB85747.1 putative tail protein [Salmonella phage seszw]QAY00243.1 putative tail protein (tape measure) [Salmonella phage Seszw_1]QZB85828.1 putative tail protein [Salmonella phage seszw]QZB85908.1 putative tail protein [Salmonella phage seszw]QZB85987.1 putative tail protein [Salmonella phage seszw]